MCLDLDRFDLGEMERMRATLQKIDPAVQRVLERLRQKGGTIREDGGLQMSS